MAVALAGFVLAACSMAAEPAPSTPAPVVEGETTAPSGLKVSATIVAATLGDDCGQKAGFAKCAGSSDASASDAQQGGCGGNYCDQSNVQLSFKASAGSKAATIEIVSVSLHDATDGILIDTLTAREPKAWDGSAYALWDEKLQPATERKASYNLSAPSWSNIGDAWARKYVLHVTLRIDGVSLALKSATLSREPVVQT